jgi:NAD(P)-dependent dehydrogenase (short-subunit alcohol dehydrogenase family)
MASIVITGASRGIGAATAIAAARLGFDIVVNYKTRAAEAEAVTVACRAIGVEAQSVAGSVTNAASVRDMFDAAEALSPLHGLVNNAGILETQSRLADMSPDRFRRVVEVNVVGTLICASEAVRRLEAQGNGGSIVNVSSAASRLGSPNEFVDYASTKGAVDTLTVGLAAEVGPSGIRVNAVRPGLIETDIHADSGEPERVQRLAPSVPLRRGGQVEEVAETIVWLLSDAASYVSGALVDVSGGR